MENYVISGVKDNTFYWNGDAAIARISNLLTYKIDEIISKKIELIHYLQELNESYGAQYVDWNSFMSWVEGKYESQFDGPKISKMDNALDDIYQALKSITEQAERWEAEDKYEQLLGWDI